MIDKLGDVQYSEWHGERNVKIPPDDLRRTALMSRAFAFCMNNGIDFDWYITAIEMKEILEKYPGAKQAFCKKFSYEDIDFEKSDEKFYKINSEWKKQAEAVSRTSVVVCLV